MSRHAIALSVFLLCILHASCHPKPSSALTTVYSELLNHRWLLKKLYPKDKDPLVPTTAIPELITRLDSTFQGFGGCNRYTGQMVLGEGNVQGKVAFTNTSATEMHCPETSMLEQAWFNALASTNQWKVQQDHLYLYQNNRLLAELEAWYE